MWRNDRCIVFMFKLLGKWNYQATKVSKTFFLFICIHFSFHYYLASIATALWICMECQTCYIWVMFWHQEQRRLISDFACLRRAQPEYHKDSGWARCPFTRAQIISSCAREKERERNTPSGSCTILWLDEDCAGQGSPQLEKEAS